MGCATNKQRRYRVSMWSVGSTTTANFRPLPRVQAVDSQSVRLDVNIMSWTSHVKAKRAWRGSNDGGKSWSAVTEIGAYVTAIGWSIGSSFSSVDDSYQLVEYGLTCVNTSGTVREQLQVDVIINVRTP